MVKKTTALERYQSSLALEEKNKRKKKRKEEAKHKIEINNTKKPVKEVIFLNGEILKKL